MSLSSSRYVLCALTLMGAAAINSPLAAQGVSSSGLRPFVTGLIPVTGRNGQVGGVLVDAKGVIRSVDTQVSKELRTLRQTVLKKVAPMVARRSKLRKISLRRLQETIVARVAAKKPIGQDIQFLAGLQRIEYIFADPDNKDIILAGPAEGWHVGKAGEFVGQSSGLPVLRLDDLVVALRAAKAPEQLAVSCSIDPTKSGLEKLQTALRRRRPASGRQLQALLGPQKITIRGAEPECHFAQVLVAADVRMKRLAMNLERAPLAGMPSYMHRLASENRVPENLMPRWWLAPDYKRLNRDELGLAWQMSGPGVKVQTRDGRLVNAQVQERQAVDPAADAWARTFSANFTSLASRIPVFGQLRGCMDLSLAATIIDRFELEASTECDLGLLVKPSPLKVASYPVAKTIPTQASFIQQRRNRIVSLSGGVAMEWQSLLDQAEEIAGLKQVRQSHLKQARQWWWD